MGHILRRTKKQLQNQCKLPARNEFIVPCIMTQAQINIYEAYLQDCETLFKLNSPKVNQALLSDGNSQNVAFTVINNLRKLCNHPFLFFKYHIDPDSLFNSGKHRYTNLENCDEYKLYLKNYKEANLSVKYWEMSSKIKVLMNFLKDWHSQNQSLQDKNKVLIFSQTKKSINILEQLVRDQGYNYQRMDGTVPISNRQDIINEFNDNPDQFVFFLTTKVGGLGINLKSANKVVIFDPDWNPMVDIQATDRALRIGQ